MIIELQSNKKSNVNKPGFDRVLDEALRVCESEPIHIPGSIQPHGVLLGIDPISLQVVLANLLTNALKYTPRGGSMGIEVAPSPSGLSLAVTDTGSGVPPEYREQIFEKFFRVEHHTGEDGGVRGAGIGLYVSRQIVEAHGGSITAGPGRGGQGTTISIALPAERAAG